MLDLVSVLKYYGCKALSITMNSTLKNLLKKLRFRNWSFSARMVFMVLTFTLLPLILLTTFSSQIFKQYILSSAEKELNYRTKGLIMLCEAQEALDRLKRGEAHQRRRSNTGDNVDAITGASPKWQDGYEYKSLRSIIKGIKIAETGYAFVVDSKGNIIIHPTLEGKNAFVSRTEFFNNFSYLREKAKKLAPGEIETFYFKEILPPTFRAKSKVAKFSYFKPYDWIIGVECYESEVMKPYYKTQIGFYSLIAFVILVFPLMVFYSAKHMMQPIVQLAEAASKIAKGEFPSIKKLGSKDEIGKLVKSFDTMVTELQKEKIQQLEDWTRKLEVKVQERSKELEMAYAQLLTMEKLASLGKIASMVAHELNNPMSGILSYARYGEMMLGRETIDPNVLKETKESLSFIATEAERCGEIVKNLLMFAKRSWGDFKQISCSEIIERTIKVLEHSIKINEINLKKEFGSGNDEFWCDPSAMEQVLIALLVNSIEVVGKGGTVTIRTDYSSEDSLTFEVTDNGPGIPPDILPHIFEPFFSGKENKMSVGLGLSVAYGIIQAHNGSIKVESNIGRGTTFIVSVPRVQPEQPRIEEKLMSAAKVRLGTEEESHET
jgi:signal transduction histidine kinase